MPPTTQSSLPTTYTPSDHEDRIRARWEASGAFHVDPDAVTKSGARPYCILIPPPNVTAPLHLGHALNNMLQDVLIRARRMMGDAALWLPGADHAGIATQTVVEKRLIAEEGKRRTDFTRDEFIARVQAWKDEYETTIRDQLLEMGCSCDWDRWRFTMDTTCAHAVREAFFRLFKEGLIYRGKRLVNWDPVTQTALADDEVDNIEIEGHFYSMRYPLVTQGGDALRITLPDGRPIEHVTVATTRPETYLGDTAVAVNGRDPRWPALRDAKAHVMLPFVGRIIPIIADEYVVMPADDPEAPGVDPKAKYATGFLKVTPAHDPNDWEIGLRHDLPVINIIAPDASISDEHGWSDVGDAGCFVGLSREKARDAVVKAFEKAGLLEEVKAYRHSVGHSYRSHAAIEPYLSDQWYVKVTDDRLVGAAQRALAPQQRTHAGGIYEGATDFSGTSNGGTGVSPVRTNATETDTDGTGVSPVRKHASPNHLTIHHRNLPHWQLGGSTYFVTFRVARGELTHEERQIAMEACTHWQSDRATVHLVTVMQDHVHMLLTPAQRGDGVWESLPELMHSIKSYAAHAILKLRGAAGRLWQSEYFDRIVRDEDEFREKWNYMLNNPVKAGLVEKPWDYTFTTSPQRQAEEKEREDGRDARPTGAEPEPETESESEDKAADETKAAASALDGGVRFFPARYAKTYESWHDNIRDWCISRQLWWGHRILVWHSSHLAVQNHLGFPPPHIANVPPDAHLRINNFYAQIKEWQNSNRLWAAGDLEKARRGDDRLELLTDEPSYWICVREKDDREVIKFLEENTFVQDEDVLDTWFSSALWPLSTMGWPEKTELLGAFNPTSVLCTAREIITLWVSRMVMFNRFFNEGKLPFGDVYIHAMIQDGDGRKMSKSLGNGVDPRDIIHSHGADAMRYTLCQMTTQTQDVRMPVDHDPVTGRNTSTKFDIGRKFCNKLWNASRFTFMMLAEAEPQANSPSSIERSDLTFIDRWMLSRLAGAVETIEQSLEDYQYSAYAQTMYDLMWRDFCDWFLEAIKPTVRSTPSQQATLRATLDVILRLLHPLCPFITEAIYEHLKVSPAPQPPGVSAPDAELLCQASWPEVAKDLRDEDLERRFDRLRELVTAIRDVRASRQLTYKDRLTLHLDDALAQEVESAQGVVQTLAGLDACVTSEPPQDAFMFTFQGAELHLSGARRSDDASSAEADQQRMAKQIETLDASIATLQKRLDNPGYANKAPAALVQQTRDQLEALQAERQTVIAAMDRSA